MRQYVDVSVGFAEFLGFLFITFKLIDVIEWSWLWVLSPFWIKAVLVIIIDLGIFAVNAYVKSHPKNLLK